MVLLPLFECLFLFNPSMHDGRKRQGVATPHPTTSPARVCQPPRDNTFVAPMIVHLVDSERTYITLSSLMDTNNILTCTHTTHAIAHVDACHSLLPEYLQQTVAIYIASTGSSPW